MTFRIIALLTVCLIQSVFALEIPAEEWLTCGPFELTQPLFSDSTVTAEDALKEPAVDLVNLRPETEDILIWSPTSRNFWQQRRTKDLSFTSAPESATVFAISYFTSDRWQKMKINVESSRAFAIYIDGKEIEKKTSADSIFKASLEFTAHSGKHTLLVHSVTTEKDSGEWTLSAAAVVDSANANSIAWSTDRRRMVSSYKYDALFETLSQPKISPDGKFLAVLRSDRDNDLKKSAWIEIYSTTEPFVLAHTIRMNTAAAAPQFYPSSSKLAFTTTENKTTIWSYDLRTSSITPLLENLSNFERFEISPDENFIYYTSEVEADEDKSGYKVYKNIEDRVSDFETTRRLQFASMTDKLTRPMTVLGEFELTSWALSAEGDKLLFIRLVPKVGRPYYATEFWIYDTKTNSARLSYTQYNAEEPDNIVWLPGGNQIAFGSGSFEAFPEDTVFHNPSPRNLYVLDINSGIARNLTGNEIECVADEGKQKRIYWNAKDKKLWFNAMRGGERVMMKVSPDGGKVEQAISSAHPFLDEPNLSRDGNLLAYIGMSPDQPNNLYLHSKNRERVVINPNADMLSDFEFGTYSDWDFVNSRGDTIEGWLYYPPDFSADKTWPVIVYYYGGVSPRDLRFSVFYQFLLANGYVLYILNPSGAHGYGQEFADLHANDWGTIATQDIIEGTEKVLAAHSYLDAAHMGATGGSYGGFITLDLMTKTDKFATAIDMYGISNITSYFGAGTWGYWYGEIALPGSYPWTRPDVFVEKSPIFRADKIKTPLLILHGGGDINVPPMESDQMFVALKLLGREATMIKFDDESHNINTKYENLIEHREMMLEWFDKYLKEQPAAWNDRMKRVP